MWAAGTQSAVPSKRLVPSAACEMSSPPCPHEINMDNLESKFEVAKTILLAPQPEYGSL